MKQALPPDAEFDAGRALLGLGGIPSPLTWEAETEQYVPRADYRFPTGAYTAKVGVWGDWKQYKVEPFGRAFRVSFGPEKPTHGGYTLCSFLFWDMDSAKRACERHYLTGKWKARDRT